MFWNIFRGKGIQVNSKHAIFVIEPMKKDIDLWKRKMTLKPQ